MSTLRAGVIGLGEMGRHHARVLRSLEGVELVAVADPREGRTESLAGPALVRGVEEILTHRPDYCVVAVPTELHEQVGLMLAEAGVHALIEKPLAASSEAADGLAEAFGRAGLVAAVGHIERYNPAIRQMRTRLEQGELGEVFQVSTRRQGPYPSRVRDVGVVLDLGTHDFDLTPWVCQQPYESLSARSAHKSGRMHEDLVAVVGHLRGGTVVSHLINWLSPTKERVVAITGERGALVADTLTADLTLHRNGSIITEWEELAVFRGVTEGDVVRFAFPKPEPLRVEHLAFRNALEGNAADVVTLSSAARTVAVAEAVLDSAALGVAVSVEP